MFEYMYNKHYLILSYFFFIQGLPDWRIWDQRKPAGPPPPRKYINKIFLDKNENGRDQHR